MSKFKLACSLIVAAAFAAGTDSVADAATDMTYAGTMCVGFDDPDQVILNYTQFGVHNVGSANAGIKCNAPVPTNAAVTQVDVTFYDRQTRAEFRCSVEVLDNAGNIIASASIFSTSGTIGPNPHTLSATFPSISAATINLSCTLPRVNNGSFSHLTTYRVRTN